MQTWEYTATVIDFLSSEDGEPSSDEGHGASALPPLTRDFVGRSPDGEQIVGLSSILNAWGQAGWELVTIWRASQTIDKAGMMGQAVLELADSDPDPATRNVLVNIDIAVFKRSSSAAG